jgi:hypothetical protein
MGLVGGQDGPGLVGVLVLLASLLALLIFGKHHHASLDPPRDCATCFVVHHSPAAPSSRAERGLPAGRRAVGEAAGPEPADTLRISFYQSVLRDWRSPWRQPQVRTARRVHTYCRAARTTSLRLRCRPRSLPISRLAGRPPGAMVTYGGRAARW